MTSPSRPSRASAGGLRSRSCCTNDGAVRVDALRARLPGRRVGGVSPAAPGAGDVGRESRCSAPSERESAARLARADTDRGAGGLRRVHVERLLRPRLARRAAVPQRGRLVRAGEANGRVQRRAAAGSRPPAGVGRRTGRARRRRRARPPRQVRAGVEGDRVHGARHGRRLRALRSRGARVDPAREFQRRRLLEARLVRNVAARPRRRHERRLHRLRLPDEVRALPFLQPLVSQPGVRGLHRRVQANAAARRRTTAAGGARGRRHRRARHRGPARARRAKGRRSARDRRPPRECDRRDRARRAARDQPTHSGSARHELRPDIARRRPGGRSRAAAPHARVRSLLHERPLRQRVPARQAGGLRAAGPRRRQLDLPHRPAAPPLGEEPGARRADAGDVPRA